MYEISKGYYRRLSEVLYRVSRAAVHAEYEADPSTCDDWVFDMEGSTYRSIVLEEIDDMKEYFLNALIGNIPTDPEYAPYIEEIRKVLMDCEIPEVREMIARGNLVNLLVDNRGYFLAEEVSHDNHVK